MSNTPGQVFLTHHNQHKSSTHQTHRRINTCTSTSLHTPTRQHTSTHQHISINTSNTINFTQHNRNNTIQCHQCINTSAHQHINTSVQQHTGWSFQNDTTHNLVLLRVLTILFVNFGISRKPWCRRFEWTTYKRKILKESRDTAILRRNIFLASGRKSRKNSRQIFGANWELLEWTQTPSLFKRPSWNHANLESSSSERM